MLMGHNGLLHEIKHHILRELGGGGGGGGGGSGGAMVLGKLPVPGRPTHLD